jgi:hypothetical protein
MGAEREWQNNDAVQNDAVQKSNDRVFQESLWLKKRGFGSVTS